MLALYGGVIIGTAVSLMLLFNGRVTGVSGIIGGLINPAIRDKAWRLAFILGLLVGGFIFRVMDPEAFTVRTNVNELDYIIAGLLVGYGTLMGNGCTSGHGVCGLSRFSYRSLIATITFIVSGILSVLLFKVIRGEL